ncbi:MAG: hypothetical protein FGM43_00070 [Sinobacteraceae bacterium]|nr:hypothetical protein [Nevskiaceae bacterium]
MRHFFVSLICLAASSFVCTAHAAPTPEQGQRYRDYLDFERLAPPVRVEPEWQADGSSFDYLETTADGRTRVTIDALRGTVKRVPSTNERATTPPAPTYPRQFLLAPPVPVPHVRSPDGTRYALVRDGDLWVREAADAAGHRLTSSAAQDIAWDLDATRLYGVSRPVPAQPWSPDGRWLFATRVDRTAVPKAPDIDFLGDDVSFRYSPVEVPGQPMPTVEAYAVEVQSGRVVPLRLGDTADRYFTLLAWLPDSSEVLFARTARDFRTIEILAADPRTGSVRTVLTERGATWVRNGHDLVYSGRVGFTLLPDGRGFLWESERDGWNHLYRYDLQGRLVSQLTRGAFPVVDVEAIDTRTGYVYLTAQAEPRVYDVHLYRVPLRGGRLERLTEHDGQHEIQFAPSLRYFLDTHSSPVRPTRVDLRRADGRLVRTLAAQDITKLEAAGWRAPEEFVVKAADGQTDLHGVMYKPYDFDPARKYPVVQHVYGGPQIAYVRRGFDPLPMPHRNHPLALAQLGYVVVVLDGRGTPGRSKAFHDAAAGDWQVVADDQAAALRHLAAQRPYLDLGRAGIYGHSWGGGNAFRAIALHADLYRAAVVSGPGLDCRTILCEPYVGLMPQAAAVYERQSLYRLAPRIRGALMLVAGTNEAPMFHAVMRMSRALVDAGVRHEVVPLPGEFHGYRGKALDYVLQATTDFFATHLNDEPVRLGPLQKPLAKPYGEWVSPVQAKDLAIGGTRYSELVADEGSLYWLEPIMTEGRTVVMRRTPSGAVETVTPAGFSVRTRVHEYGGGGLRVARGVVYFTNARDQQLWRQRPGAPPEALTRETGTRYANCAADPARQRLVCVREDHRGAGEPRNALVAVPLTAGPPVILFEDTDFVSDPAFDAAGGRLAFLAWNHPNMPWDRVEVRVAKVRADGSLARPRAINAGIDEAARTPRWGGDGSLYFVGDRDGWWNFLRWDGKRVHAVTRESLEFGFAAWELGAETWSFLPDGRIVSAYNEAGDEGIAVIDPRDGRVQRLAPTVVGARSVAARDGKAWFEAGFRDRAHALVELDLASGSLEVLRSSASPGFEVGASSAVAVSYPTTDGMTAHGFYYPPAHPQYRGPDGAKPPLIVIAHGGPTNHTTPAYNVGTHYWTSRGFAVLDLNYRGSTGFGRDYRRSLYGRMGEYDVADAVQGAKYVAERGLADPDRLLIRGNSAGGFIVLAALTFHDVFRAGANYFGVSDLAALRADTHKFESRYIETLIGPWPAQRDRYRELSPIYNLDGLDRPLIVFQGLDDKVVPPDQSSRIVEALRTRGIPIAYLEFAGEAHGFRQLKTNVEAREAELAFYGRILGFEPAGELPAVRIDNLPQDP